MAANVQRALDKSISELYLHLKREEKQRDRSDVKFLSYIIIETEPGDSALVKFGECFDIKHPHGKRYLFYYFD